MRLLLLWDIDGTLLRYGGAREHAAAIVDALRDAYGLELPDDAVTRVGPWGKTDQQIAREILVAAGLDEPAIAAGSERWMTRAWEIYAAADLARLSDGAMPGAADALAAAKRAGHVNALLTGNMERVAHHKLAAAGLARWFERGQGAFGSDAEDRRLLVPIARRRAGGWPAAQTVVIGDAPGDVACALADGARCVALLGHFDDEQLAGADAFVERLDQLADVLARIGSD